MFIKIREKKVFINNNSLNEERYFISLAFKGHSLKTVKNDTRVPTRIPTHVSTSFAQSLRLSQVQCTGYPGVPGYPGRSTQGNRVSEYKDTGG
eukprot:1548871-Rhodomonas_salina.3